MNTRHPILAAMLACAVAVLASCKPPAPPPAPVAAAPAALPDAGPPPLTPAEADVLVQTHCQACHARQMVEQQHITPAQWKKAIHKMRGWGATLPEGDEDRLAAHLASTLGAAAPAWAPKPVDAAAQAALLMPLPDGDYAGGNAAAGGALFVARCAVCHGADALGGVGINLRDRPLLFRAPELAATVRAGRGLMPAAPDLTNAQLADIVAHLRSLDP